MINPRQSKNQLLPNTIIDFFGKTLLTAMFSTTILKVEGQSEQLWMFQRYEIVVEYEKRIPFGPPFTLIYYLYMFMNKVWKILKRFSGRCKLCLSCFCFKHAKKNLYVEEKGI